MLRGVIITLLEPGITGMQELMFSYVLEPGTTGMQELMFSYVHRENITQYLVMVRNPKKGKWRQI